MLQFGEKNHRLASYNWCTNCILHDAIRANGHILLNSKKMSKSMGNFMTMADAVEKFTRLALADAGDSIEDVDFVEKKANGGFLRLYSWIEWVREIMAKEPEMRTGEQSFADKVFLADISRLVRAAQSAYEKGLFRDAVKHGIYDLQAARDSYKELSLGDMHRDITMKYIEVQAVVMSPICPHIAEYTWKVIGKVGSVLREKWPATSDADPAYVRVSSYISGILPEFRARLRIVRSRIPAGKVVLLAGEIQVTRGYPAWQLLILQKLTEMWKGDGGGSLPENRQLAAHLLCLPELKHVSNKVMTFVQKVKERIDAEGAASALSHTFEIDEAWLWKECKSYIQATLELERLPVIESVAQDFPGVRPGRPLIKYIKLDFAELTFVNAESACTRHLDLTVPILYSDSAEVVIARIRRLIDRSIPSGTKLFIYYPGDQRKSEVSSKIRFRICGSEVIVDASSDMFECVITSAAYSTGLTCCTQENKTS